jgi:nucleoid DNA-binding protein
MNKRHWLGLGAFLVAMGFILIPAAPVHSEKPKAEVTFLERVAKGASMDEEPTSRVLRSLPLAMREDLRRGKSVTLAGLGTFRIVRVEGHKDLQQGRPVVVEPLNTVEFVPEGGLLDAANSANVQPAVVVPEFKYIPLPSQTPGQRQDGMRMPPVRTRS